MVGLIRSRSSQVTSGFDANCTIDRGLFGEPETSELEWREISVADQIKLIGNSRSPDKAEALIAANAADIINLYQRMAA